MLDELNKLLTVVIPVKNEEKNLPECLESVKGLEHVVVVDSGSTDSTCDIAARYGREVVQFKWNGQFPKKRNWMLRNYKFETPWVMFLDADERMTPDFVDELSRTLPTTSHVAFFVCLNNWFLGRLLKHGKVPRKTAILKLGHGEYEHIEERSWSKLDMEIHEHILVDGTTGTIRGRLEHYDKRSLSSYYEKHNQYSSWEAHRTLVLKDYSHLPWWQRIKYRLMKSKILPYAYFFYTYIWHGGFMDGLPGYYFALAKFMVVFQVQAKMVEIKAGRWE